MDEMCANIGGLIANLILLLLFFKLVWPLICHCITVIDSFILTLVLGFAIKDKVFHGSLHPVFIILIFAGIFIGLMWIMHTKYGFAMSALLMSYVWTDFILECCKGWKSYDLIWGIFIGVCSFLLILYFHWRDYRDFAPV